MDPVILTFDGHNINDGTNYESAFAEGTFYRLQKADVITARRIAEFPLWTSKSLGGSTLTIHVMLQGTMHSQRDELAKWFDVYDTGGEKELVIKDAADSDRQWYVMCDPVSFVPKDRKISAFTVTLEVPDPVWREKTEQSQVWNVTATGQTQAITARGNRPTPLKIEYKPTANKTVDYGYSRLCVVRNRNDWELADYPVDITDGGWDTATIVGGGYMQADGDDLRVYVDDVEVDRWLANMNSANTKVWINLTLRPAARVKLDGAFNIGDDRLEYRPRSLDGEFPRKNGFLRIDDEIISYFSWEEKGDAFTACERGVWGTTEANHSDGTWAYWIEHHIEIRYGDSALTAPDTDDELKPAFELDDSTNTSWVYVYWNNERHKKRTGGWQRGYMGGLRRLQSVDWYSGNQGTYASPWVEMGLLITKDNPSYPGDYHQHWVFHSQVEITQVAFNGEYKVDHASDRVKIALQEKVLGGRWRPLWWQLLTTNTTWTAWSKTTTATTEGCRSLRFKAVAFAEGDPDGKIYFEVAEGTLTLDSAETPDVDGPTTWGAVSNPYHAKPKFTNQTTGEWIELVFSMRINETLTIDSELQKITYGEWNSNEFQAIRQASKWEEWIMLDPGSNTIKLDETGLAAVTATLKWRGRNS